MYFWVCPYNKIIPIILFSPEILQCFMDLVFVIMANYVKDLEYPFLLLEGQVGSLFNLQLALATFLIRTLSFLTQDKKHKTCINYFLSSLLGPSLRQWLIILFCSNGNTIKNPLLMQYFSSTTHSVPNLTLHLLLW